MDNSARSTRSAVDNCRGYTLIELVVVLIIIGVIASVAMKSLTAVNDTVRIEETKRELAQIAYAIAGNPDLVSGGLRTDYGFVGDNGRLPANLDALVSQPSGYTNWDGPYITDQFSSDGSSSEYKNDGWGKAYSYSGGLTVSSTGGSSTITRILANSTGELLRNNAAFTFTDLDFTPPGPDHRDSVRFILYYPSNGSLTSRTNYPANDGSVAFDSVPIGIHTLQVIYLPDNDSLTRKVSVAPGQDYYTDVQYFADLWTADTAGGGGGTGCDSSGTLILRPTGPGSITNLSTGGCSNNWECVDETTADEDATRVVCPSSSFVTDVYALEDPPSTDCSITSVTVYARAHRAQLQGQISPTVYTYSNEHNGSTQDLSSSYANYSEQWTTNPSTGNAWTWTEITNLQAGLELSGQNSVFPAYCTQVWVEVSYSN
jgi:prepilin-type N-terminal cleavage/methylation domain-containing protein